MTSFQNAADLITRELVRRDTASGTVIDGDAVTALKSLPDSCIDLVITDPPYESLEKHRSVGTTTRLKQSKSSSNPWFHIFHDYRFPELFHHLYRVMKPDSHLFVFSNDESAYAIKPAAEAAGFKYWKQLVWVKVTKKMEDESELTEEMEDELRMGMGYHYRGSNERILFLEKGKRNLNDWNKKDTLISPRVNNGYPAEKPAKIIRELLTNSSGEGDVVLDCFAGSGVVGTVARETNRKFVLIDVNTAEITARGLCD